MHRFARTFVAAIFIAACGDASTAPVAQTPPPAPPVQAAPVSPPAPPPPPARDHEDVPDFAIAPACAPSGGDARAVRTRLRALERGNEPTPPELAPLLDGCAVPRADVARSLFRASTAFVRKHDLVAASAYARRALEADPGALDARFGLIAIRSAAGDVPGAIYQLDQLRAAGPRGARYLDRVMRDGRLAQLRLSRAFWTWAHDPTPETVSTLPTDATETSPTTLAYTLALEPAIATASDVIFERARLASPHYALIARLVRDATGSIFRGYRGVKREDLVGGGAAPLAGVGGELLTGTSLFRLTETETVLAIPFYGELGDYVGPVSIVAIGPWEGPYSIVHVLQPSESCAEPVLFASRDHRSVGWLTACAEAEDASAFGRCVMFAREGRVVTRCGTGAVGLATSDGDDDQDYGDDW